MKRMFEIWCKRSLGLKDERRRIWLLKIKGRCDLMKRGLGFCEKLMVIGHITTYRLQDLISHVPLLSTRCLHDLSLKLDSVFSHKCRKSWYFVYIALLSVLTQEVISHLTLWRLFPFESFSLVVKHTMSVLRSMGQTAFCKYDTIEIQLNVLIESHPTDDWLLTSSCERLVLHVEEKQDESSQIEHRILFYLEVN